MQNGASLPCIAIPFKIKFFIPSPLISHHQFVNKYSLDKGLSVVTRFATNESVPWILGAKKYCIEKYFGILLAAFIIDTDPHPTIAPLSLA